MANVTHQLLIMLAAKVDSTFGASFTSAQKSLADMQRQIKAYDSTIANVKKYSSLTESLEKLETELADTKAKMEALKGTEEESGAEATRLANQKSKLNTQITELKGKISGLKGEIEGTTTEEQRLEAATKADEAAFQALVEKLRASGDEGNRYADILIKARQESEKLKKEQEELAAQANKISDLTQAFSALGIMASQASNAVDKVRDAVKAVVDTSAEFEYTVSAVEAVSGATKQEVSALSDMAKEMGRTTVFTAQECAEAMETQALAGWEVEDMLSGLPAVIKLAAAAGEDLADMTSIVSDALNAFGLEGEAATNKFADVLTKAATSANTNVSLMGESLSYVETTAGNLGYSIEDVSLALAQMANNALKGSVSGSSLNTMLTRMSGANASAAGEMERLGLSMYNETEQAKPLLQFINELREAFSGMTEQEAQISAYKLAGQRGMRGLLALVNSSEEEWQSLTDSVYAYAGAASSIADTRLDNYTGQVTLLKSAWNDLQITVGEKLLPAWTAWKGVITDVITKVDELADAAPNATAGLAAGVSTAAYEMKGLCSLLENASMGMMGLNSMAGLLQKLGKADSLMTGLMKAGKITGATVAVTALVAAIANAAYTAYNADETFSDLAESIEETAEASATAREQYESAISGYERERDAVNGLINDLSSLLLAEREYGGQEEAIREKVDELNAALPGLALEYSGVGTEISKTTSEIRQFNNAMSASEVSQRRDYLNSLQSDIDTYQNEIELLEKVQNQKREEDIFYNEYARKKDEGAWSWAAWWTTDGATLGDVKAYKEYIESLGLAQEELNEATEAYNVILEELRADARDTMDSMGVEGISEDDFLTIEENMATVIEAYDSAYQAAYESITGQYTLWDEAGEYINQFGKAYQEAFDSALESYKGQFNIWDEVNWSDEPATFGDLLSNQSDQGTFWENYRANLAALKDSGVDLADIWEQLTDGSMDSYYAVRAMRQELDGGGTGALQEYAEKVRETYGDMTAVAQMNAEAQKVTLDDLKENLRSQIEAWDGYRDSVQKLQNLGFDLTGLNLNGSEESMSLAAAMLEDYNRTLQETGGDASAARDSVQEFIDLMGQTGATQTDMATALAGLSEEVQRAVQDMVAAMDASNFDEIRGVLGDIAADVLAGWTEELSANPAALKDPLVASIETAMDGAREAAGTHSASTITHGIALDVGQGWINGVEEKAEAMTAALTNAASSGMGAFSSMMSYSSFRVYGINAMQGAISGINAMRSSLITTAYNAGLAAANAYKTAQDINSPSKKFEWFSEMDMIGAVVGIEKNKELVNRAMEEAAKENSVAYLSGGTALPGQTTTNAEPFFVQAMDDPSEYRATWPRSMENTAPGGFTIQVTYAPEINAVGADAPAFRRILEEDKESLVGFLDDWADERELDRRRRSY